MKIYLIRTRDGILPSNIYTKPGPAKCYCTTWLKQEDPEVLEFDLDQIDPVVIPMGGHIREHLDRKARAKALREENRRAYEAIINMKNAKNLLKVLTADQKRALGIKS